MPKYRKSTWALILWTALVAYRIIAALAAASTCHGQGCGTGRDIGLILVLFIGGMGFVLLGFVWAVSKRNVQPPATSKRPHAPTA